MKRASRVHLAPFRQTTAPVAQASRLANPGRGATGDARRSNTAAGPTVGWAGAELLFDVIATAYERNSLIDTTNLPFENWTEVLGSERLTGAALDRLTAVWRESFESRSSFSFSNP
jgi:hypothetical protein